ncbi:GldG family protein [Nodosilinea nodulosa]|uniref:GldG family protein n=1 Tax=Nodosilinea nodulosa TaxID=416001 RepID=UPI0004751B96|nr:Gldg family protein [Nodosilinea nodulosa]
MKSFAAYQKYLKYLALPGLALVTAGLMVGIIAGWTLLPAGLLLAGIGLLLLGLVLGNQGQGRFWAQRSTEAGANALVSTLAVLVILGLVNFLAVRYASRVDLTENQLFTLAPQSQEVVKSLNTPARVVIFDPVPNPQDRQLLESYRQRGPKFTFDYVNPYNDPRQAQEFGATQTGMVFIESGDTRRFLQNVSPTERLSERTLTNALDQVENNRALTVYFTQGHKEFAIDGSDTGFSQAAAALEEKSDVVKPLDLSKTSKVPDDASVVVVAGPAAEFFEPEVKALQTYLDGGGSLMLLIDPRTSPGLGTLLDPWGVTLDDRIVLDTSGSGQLVGLGPAAPLVTDYGDHPITRDFNGGRSFFPLVRPINVEEVPGVTATPILQSNPQSRAEAISTDGKLQYDENAPPSGPYTLGVALSRPVKGATAAADEPPPEARLVVIGNATFATDGLFEQQLNGDVFLNSVSWLGQQTDATLSIRPREVTNRRITLTVQQQIGLGVFALLVLPVIGLGLAVIMWLRRR